MTDLGHRLPILHTAGLRWMDRRKCSNLALLIIVDLYFFIFFFKVRPPSLMLVSLHFFVPCKEMWEGQWIRPGASAHQSIMHSSLTKPKGNDTCTFSAMTFSKCNKLVSGVRVRAGSAVMVQFSLISLKSMPLCNYCCSEYEACILSIHHSVFKCVQTLLWQLIFTDDITEVTCRFNQL